ncbi:hypothetical protein AVEN_46178-1 [Araneus ventricosus]|uniref:Uncharacterized protein n=1 Tax=Araneus ventricosus TaxID=182803 RepID=A0A4Y2E7F3_ARAVE|nr:hypothetical protein AVEN_46178-1 [Araneus ventricosus]
MKTASGICQYNSGDNSTSENEVKHFTLKSNKRFLRLDIYERSTTRKFDRSTPKRQNEKLVYIGVVWSGMSDIQPVAISIAPFALPRHKSGGSRHAVNLGRDLVCVVH